MLQKTLLRLADLVKLVDVYQREAVQIKFRILLARKVDAVRIVGADGRRSEAAASNGDTLLAYFLSIPLQWETMFRNQR